MANGSQALYANTTGEDNTANGFEALYYNTTGFENTANGVYALYRNTTAYDNTADGYEALLNNTTGHNNIALGVSAGSFLPLAITISISATVVLLARPIPSGSGCQEPRAPPLSLAFME